MILSGSHVELRNVEIQPVHRAFIYSRAAQAGRQARLGSARAAALLMLRLGFIWLQSLESEFVGRLAPDFIDLYVNRFFLLAFAYQARVSMVLLHGAASVHGGGYLTSGC